MYTMDKVKMIFDKEKILIGNTDVMPSYRAVEIFGKDAVKFAEKCLGKDANIFAIGEFQLSYLYYSGVRVAATYVNICNIRDVIAERNGIVNEEV